MSLTDEQIDAIESAARQGVTRDPDVLALIAEVRELRTGIVAAIASRDAHETEALRETRHGGNESPEEHYAQGAVEHLVLELVRETVKP